MRSIYCWSRRKWAAVMSAHGEECPERQVECSGLCPFAEVREVPVEDAGLVTASMGVARMRARWKRRR